MKKFYLLCFYVLTLAIVKAQTCTPSFVPDLPLISSNITIDEEINTIYQKSSDDILGNTPPTTSAVDAAILSYNNLNIVTSGNTISGNAIGNFNNVSFIGVFATYLKFNPTDNVMIERVKNTIWWVSQSLCSNTLTTDYNAYAFKNFARKGVFAAIFTEDQTTKNRFLYIVEKNSGNFPHFFNTDYSDTYQSSIGAINTDFIHNYIEMMVPLVKCFTTADEQYRYMVTLKRFINKFLTTYTVGTRDGLKIDGSGYHHWNNYEAYMYAYSSLAYAISYFDNSTFQISSTAYLNFRDAVMHKILYTNDSDLLALNMTGRSGNWDGITIYQSALKSLAISGGKILGLTTADPVLAGIYNRKYGVDSSFNYPTISPFETGFYQNNFANAGVFRKNNYLAICKGFNDQLWGSEAYVNSNRYGRYQSYGALSIVYPGTRENNGFNNLKWNWNYNPGTTTKVLPWDKLIAGWERLDEYSSKKFAGTLMFNLKNGPYLKKVIGNLGMFAMDFQERPNLGFNAVTAPETHDASFVFKKSYFFFDDFIVALGSNINNNDVSYPTVTTLYQNVTTPNNVIIDNTSYTTVGSTTTYSGNTNHWILDNFGTGYVIVSGSGNLKVERKDQQTPSHNQTNPTVLNAASQAGIGYLDHGASPVNKQYEYVVLPNSSATAVQSFANTMSSTSTKPYTIISKNANSHIVNHKGQNIYGLALFTANTSISGNLNVISNDTPCLIMYQPNSTNTSMKLSLSNPDLGMTTTRSYEILSPKTIRIVMNGNWQLAAPVSGINFISSTSTSSTFDFATINGLPIEGNFEKTTSTNNNTTPLVSLYPNPTSSILNIASQKTFNWKIYNSSGVLVKKGYHGGGISTTNLSQLVVGNYILTTTINTTHNIIKQ